MKTKSLKEMVSKKEWQQLSSRLQKEETIAVLHKLFDYITEILTSRIDEIKVNNGRAISFFSNAREFLTINVTRKDLRIYIHPPAQAFFDPEKKFKVERFRFWEASYHKTSGKYRAMSVWISESKYLLGVKEIIGEIPDDRKR